MMTASTLLRLHDGRWQTWNGDAGRWPDAIAVVDEQTEPMLPQVGPTRTADLCGNQLAILIAPKLAPVEGVRMDGEVRSFVATGAWTEHLRTHVDDTENLCFRALAHALGSEGDAIQLRACHRPASPLRPFPERHVEIIVPHRGEDHQLLRCIASLNSQTLPGKTTVCFDQDADERTLDALARFPRLTCHAISPAPSGPYLIRQHFGLMSGAEFIVFQDSDDVALPTRLATLVAAAEEFHADIVGSHELRLDEITGTVLAARFPQDVNAALRIRVSHPQLFPTTLVRANTFRTLGGLSTVRTFGSDSEFLLRAHFEARIINVDEFLYVRRKRPNSLTTAAPTALDSPERLYLDRVWKRDFEAIKAGELALSHSSLAVRHGDDPATVRGLWPKKSLEPIQRQRA